MLFPSLHAAAGPLQGIGSFFIPLVLIFGVMYWFMIRPQQKRANEHKTMLANLKKGDRVVTIGGLIGSIQRIDDSCVVVEVCQDVQITVLKTAIANYMLDKEANKEKNSKPVAHTTEKTEEPLNTDHNRAKKQPRKKK